MVPSPMIVLERICSVVIFSGLYLGMHVDGTPACDSEIWCHGELLQTVQNARLYPDSKTFVDMNLKYQPSVVIEAFKNLSKADKNSKARVEEFVTAYFEGPNMEFEDWKPGDYKENPKFLDKINDKLYRRFGKDLCSIWSRLGRKISEKVKAYPFRYSLIYLEHPFIVPGGRFRETYYWDSYWVVKGLLTCEMYDTVKGMLLNFISLIDKYGMVPNGNRVYYTRRSQPPLFIPMVEAYLTATDDLDFLRTHFNSLNQEYNFWVNNRSVEVTHEGHTYYMNRYATEIDEPRPESYREDIQTYTSAPADRQQNGQLYTNIASAAESGWDFSSRWFSWDYAQTGNQSTWLASTETTSIVPVDLNSILCWNTKILAKLYKRLNNTERAKAYDEIATLRMRAIAAVLWDNSTGAWSDYSLKTNSSRSGRFYPSNIFPLFVGCHGSDSGVEDNILQYLQSNKVLGYESGVPTSLETTGQQWDYPNAWPPLQDVIVTSLANSPNQEAKDEAFRLASSWLYSNYKGFYRTKRMFEKYIVTSLGSRGSGGEYDVQEGFGWTNGFVLDLLSRYGDKLQNPDSPTDNGRHITPNVFLLLGAIGAIIVSWNILELTVS